MKKIVLSVFFLSGVLSATAQEYKILNESGYKMPFFNHLDASLTLGTTGIGFDVATPVGNYVQFRAGWAFMLPIHQHMHFDVQVGETKESKYDANGNRVETKFDKMAALLEDLSGYKVEDEVEMIGRPTYHNLKVMVDVFPFIRDRRWHITAGFFWGPSKIADGYNVTEAMPSLLALGMYNRLYDKTMISYESVQKFRRGEIAPYEIIPVFSIGQYEINSPTEIESLYKMLSSYGRMGMPLGKMTDENGVSHTYMMVPNEEGMVKAEVRTNSFKPYLGVGYGGRLLKDDDRFHVAVDLGAMFWGGSPRIITHDGTDLARDVHGIKGKVGDYVEIIKGFKVFPVVDVRFIYSIF